MKKHNRCGSVLIVAPVSTDETTSIKLYATNIYQGIRDAHMVDVQYFQIRNWRTPRLISKLTEGFIRYVMYPIHIAFSGCATVHITDHTYAFLSLVVKAFHKKCIITVHNRIEDVTSNETLRAHEEYMFIPWLSKALFKFSVGQLHRADILICVSESIRKSLQNHSIPKNKLALIYMPISDVFFSKLTRRERSYVNRKEREKHGSFYVLHVGNNDNAHKNVEYLFSCIKMEINRKRKVYLLKVGDPFNERQNGLIKKLQIQRNIKHLGVLNQNSLKRVYHYSDALLFPSFYEGCPAPPFEALLCNVPIIISDIPPHRELFSNCAYFVNPHAPTEAALIIERLLDTKHGLNKRLAAGAQKSPKIRWSTVVRETTKVYEQT